MTLEELAKIENELEQISRTYEIFNEDIRLHRSQAARVEFLTTVRYIEKYVRPGARILDVGAGTGMYSFYFAEQGYHVDALELADENVRVFREKMEFRVVEGAGQMTMQDSMLSAEHKIQKPLDLTLRQGNAMDLSAYPDDSYDIVLLFGPLYHLHSEADRQQCIAEARRVCKKDGVLFFAFISNDMVILTEFGYDLHYFASEDYDHDTFQVKDFPFVFLTVEQCRQMLTDGGVEILHEVASDGVSELMAERINALSAENYQQYLRYHFYVCEKPEMLGRSNHLLFVGRK